MSRPLAWVLTLAATVVAVLLVLTSRPAVDRATPVPDAVLAQQASGDSPLVELAALPAVDAGPEVESTSRAPARVDTAPNLDPGTIEVRVVCAEDWSPIAGAQVLVAPHGPWDHLPRIPTGRDGTVLQSDLRFGRWTVRAVADGRSERVEFVTLSADNPSASVLVKLPRVPIVAEDREVRVRIVDADGRPGWGQSLGIHGSIAMSLDVGVTRDCTEMGSKFRTDVLGNRRASRSLRADGLQWTIVNKNDSWACIHLLVNDRVVARHQLKPFETEVTFQKSDLDLENSTAACELRIVDDAGGEPVPGAWVMVMAAGGASWHLQSDEVGRVPLGRLLIGEVKFNVLATGFAPEQFAIQIPTPGPVVVRLARPRRAQGIVLDLSGAPVEGARIVMYCEDEPGDALADYGYSLQSGKGGRFSFETLPRKQFILAAVKGSSAVASPPTPLTVGGYRITAVDLPELGGDRETTEGQVSGIGAHMEPGELHGAQPVDLRDGDAPNLVLRIDRSQL